MRAGVAIACAAVAVSAPIASAAMLKVTVSPTTVHRNQTYTIAISGRYHRRGRDGTPHLLAFIQYTGAACRPTATAEYRLPFSDWNWLIYPRPETSRQFKQVFYEQARTRFGNRRICAYLYPTSVTPQTTAKPIVRAGAAYREVRQPL